MRILFLSDNYPPETNAPATRVFEHARVWARAGHRVTVITCAPNFPEGRLHPGWKNRWYTRDAVEGVDVVRVKTYIAPNSGFGRRALDHLSFLASGFLAGLVQERPDVVVATSPQFFAALAGHCVAAVRRVPFVFELRDLWPASIAAVGAMKDGLVLRLLQRLELFLYRRAAAIVALTETFQRNLVARGIDERRIAVVTNGVDLSTYRPILRDQDLARQLGLEGRFVVGYLGTHGMAHALERVLDAAEVLRERSEIRFLFAGAGAAREHLMRSARSRGLKSAVFLEPQPKERMPAIWSLCDAALVHLKDAAVFRTVIPSKIFEAMAMGVPILLAAPDGEASAIVRRTGCGLCVPAEKPFELAAAVERLCDDRALSSNLGNAGRDAAPAFDRERLAGRMLLVLEAAASAALLRSRALRQEVR